MTLSLRFKADLALAAVCLIWGATFVVVKAALADASPLVFLLARFALATLVLVAIFHRHASLWKREHAGAGAVVGAFLCAGYIFQTVGLKHTTPAKSAFITTLSVVLVPLIVVLVFRGRLRPATVAGVAAATAGMYLLTVPPGSFTMSRGDFITSFCAVAFAAHIVALGHYAPRHGFAVLSVWQVAAALAILAVAVPLADASGLEAIEFRLTTRLALALVVTAVLATAVAFSVQSWAQQFTLPTHTAIIFSLEPVFAALTSYLVFGERLGGRGWLGAGLILMGVLVAELRGAPAGQARPG